MNINTRTRIVKPTQKKRYGHHHKLELLSFASKKKQKTKKMMCYVWKEKNNAHSKQDYIKAFTSVIKH